MCKAVESRASVVLYANVYTRVNVLRRYGDWRRAVDMHIRMRLGIVGVTRGHFEDVGEVVRHSGNLCNRTDLRYQCL